MRYVQTLSRRPAPLAAAIALAGMAYCHVEDVGMKFDEHVYYMAILFLGNIAASLLLIPALAVAYTRGSEKAIRAVWIAAGGLALTTIACFIWSRTIGFPQMADHIGEWDTLGLTSLGFEAAVVALSVVSLVRVGPRTVAVASSLLLLAVVGVTAASAHAMPPMTMIGDPSPYPNVAKATPAHRSAVQKLWRATKANAWRFRSVADAGALGYAFNAKEDKTIGFPGLRHMRMNNSPLFSGKVLDPTAPQSLVYWCTSKPHCTLAAFMYRAPRHSRPKTYGGLLAWHEHGGRSTWMTHIWITRTLRSGLARCAPWPFLQSALGIKWRPWHEDVEADMACPRRGHRM